MGVRIVIGITSDIGSAVAYDWENRGHSVLGTYRNEKQIAGLQSGKNKILQMDLTDSVSIETAIKDLGDMTKESGWDALLIATGTMEPIGPFPNLDFASIRSSFEVNFLGTLQIIHGLLPAANYGAKVIVFSGAGTNGSADNYFSYSVSKVANIKMCELLHSEVEHVCFTALGPGWVQTKIHEETLKAGLRSGENFFITENRIAQADMYSSKDVLQAINWLLEQDPELVGGRNFSSANDPLLSTKLVEELKKNPDLFKLRRLGNELAVSDKKEDYLYKGEA